MAALDFLGQGLANAVLPIEEIRKRILISGIVGGAFGILLGILVASRPVRLVKGASLTYDPEQSGDPEVVAATMSKPGVVLKRPVGSDGPFRESLAASRPASSRSTASAISGATW